MSLDTGQMAIDAANRRIAIEEELGERYRKRHTCRQCDFCEEGWIDDPTTGVDRNIGFCEAGKFFISESELDETIYERGCFE